MSLMCEVAYKIPGATVCQSTISHVSFFTSVDIDPSKGSAIMLNFQKRVIAGKIWIEPTEESVFFQRLNPDITDRLTNIETCAGIGAMGKGFHECGVQTVCYNDFNPNFCNWLRAKTSVPVVEGNVKSPSTILAIHCKAPNAHMLTGGVACQPFSALGDRREEHDQRSESFTGTLELGFFLKVTLIFWNVRRKLFIHSGRKRFSTSFVCSQGTCANRTFTTSTNCGLRCAQDGGQCCTILASWL